MKQALQSLQTGAIEVVEAPTPALKPGTLLIGTLRTVISSGTERMLQEFGRANWIDKARRQPDKVKMVLDKIRTDGLMPTVEAVQAKLDQPVPLGYCNCGTVLEVGMGVQGFEVGDRVVSNGYHAEVVRVPANLCARVPKEISADSAAFTVLGAIALQGIRLAKPSLGEAVVVSGLGLVGLITVQLLRAHGCRVLGIDYLSDRIELASSFGAETINLSKEENPVEVATEFSRGRGVDAVLITASTGSSEPVSQAAKMCRKRGRIVLVGVTGLELSRADFYEKELTFQVSCSYGPGRYDPAYEEKGHDYPVGYVRWTEQRNFEAVLDMMVDGRMDVVPLISHRFSIDFAEKAYALLGSKDSSLGILLEYLKKDDLRQDSYRITLSEPSVIDHSFSNKSNNVVVGFIGAGNHAARVLMPAFKKAGAKMHTVVSSGGISAARFGRKFSFKQASTDVQTVFQNSEIGSVVIATRHDSHAHLVCGALEAGKNVFVEKPLALTLEELDRVAQSWQSTGSDEQRPVLMVGFNRRFAPHVVKMKDLLLARPEPKALVMAVNAGMIPQDHWVQDLENGGGRIIGEACHFVDLLRYLVGANIEEHHSQFLGKATDTASISLNFADGSIGNIHYFGNGNKSIPKERLEVFCGGRVLQLNNFRRLRSFGWGRTHKSNLLGQNKGHLDCVYEFLNCDSESRRVAKRTEEFFETSRVAIEISNVLRRIKSVPD